MSSQRTVGAVALAASLIPVLTGLVASAVLAVDSLRPSPVFCIEGGGCDALKHTPFAAPLGVPMPIVGLCGFLAIGTAAVFSGRRARMAQLGLSCIAGLVGVALLTVQALLGKLCPYCCVVDASGIVSACLAAWRFLRAPADPPRGSSYVAAASLLAGAVVPFVAGFRASSVPLAIRAEMTRTPPGEITVVDFVDFECPFCRMTHAELAPLLDRHRPHVRLARRQVPLSIHPHAHDAARAACCGELMGKGDAMAEALFAAPVDELTGEGCERIAQAIGLALGPYRACVSDPATDARIEADRAEFKAAGGFALPTIWIDGKELVGAQPRESLEKAIERALARARGRS